MIAYMSNRRLKIFAPLNDMSSDEIADRIGTTEYIEIDAVPQPIEEYTIKNGKLVRDASAVAKRIIVEAQRIADTKTKAAKAMLAGKESISEEQEQRYREKYDAAKAYLAAPDDATAALFAAEAEAAGVSVDELCQLIVETGDAWAAAVRSYAIMIDSGRVAVQKLAAAGKLDAAQTLLYRVSALGADATPEQLAALVKEATEGSA